MSSGAGSRTKSGWRRSSEAFAPREVHRESVAEHDAEEGLATVLEAPEPEGLDGGLGGCGRRRGHR